MNAGPKRKGRHRLSYNEGADEAPSLINKESTDIERETPSDETEPVEQVETDEDVRPAIDE